MCLYSFGVRICLYLIRHGFCAFSLHTDVRMVLIQISKWYLQTYSTTKTRTHVASNLSALSLYVIGCGPHRVAL
jgi:hypothetical protein